MRITYIPTLSEHLRARRALREVASIPDAYAMLPWLLVVWLVGTLITQVANPEAQVWAVFTPMFATAGCFFAGIGIRARRDAGKALTVDLGDDGIELRQPRHRWSVPWNRVEWVSETDEFFLVVTPRAAFYLPKRVLAEAGDQARLRAMLHARGAERPAE